MISDEVSDLMRERWHQTIPEQYRARERRSGQDEQNRHLSSAIILGHQRPGTPAKTA
jgi:hypothetical protein